MERALLAIPRLDSHCRQGLLVALTLLVNFTSAVDMTAAEREFAQVSDQLDDLLVSDVVAVTDGDDFSEKYAPRHLGRAGRNRLLGIVAHDALQLTTSFWMWPCHILLP